MKIGVIGAGTMGQGIAKAFAQVEGNSVALCDIKQEWAENVVLIDTLSAVLRKAMGILGIELPKHFPLPCILQKALEEYSRAYMHRPLIRLRYKHTKI